MQKDNTKQSTAMSYTSEKSPRHASGKSLRDAASESMWQLPDRVERFCQLLAEILRSEGGECR